MRRFFTKRFRMKRAMEWVERAEKEHAEALVLSESPLLSDIHAKRSIEYELNALRWWPVEHPGQVPLPGEERLDEWGANPSEQPLDEWHIECVLCGEPIKRGRGPGEGLYCAACLAA